jgi:hypothetical protein
VAGARSGVYQNEKAPQPGGASSSSVMAPNTVGADISLPGPCGDVYFTLRKCCRSAARCRCSSRDRSRTSPAIDERQRLPSGIADDIAAEYHVGVPGRREAAW